jgi:hypothetical protein
MPAAVRNRQYPMPATSSHGKYDCQIARLATSTDCISPPVRIQSTAACHQIESVDTDSPEATRLAIDRKSACSPPAEFAWEIPPRFSAGSLAADFDVASNDQCGHGQNIVAASGSVRPSTNAQHAAAALGPRRRSNMQAANPTRENRATCTLIQRMADTIVFMVRLRIGQCDFESFAGY